MLCDPDRQVMKNAYARWAPVYDVLCGPVFVNGQRAASRVARAVGGCILEIGVGTGLSFDDYDATTEITGIDVSGVPVAGFPAAAPRDVIGEAPVGRLDEDLARACLEALECARGDCRDFALGMT